MESKIAPDLAQIHWRTEDRGDGPKVAEVRIFERALPFLDADQRLPSSAGACCADWLSGADSRSTPEGVYVLWVSTGFIDDEAHHQALDQLAKIAGLDWARAMAAALLRHMQRDESDWLGDEGEAA